MQLVGFIKQSFVRPDSDSVEVSDDLCKALGVQRDVFKGAAKMEKVLQQVRIRTNTIKIVKFQEG